MAAGTPALWLDPGFGASGDMMLGTLIGLGAPIEAVRDGLASLPVTGWTIGWETTLRGSLASGRAIVSSEEQSHHRSWSSIDAMLVDAGLPDRVETGARRTFRRLGEVEAGIHNVSIDEVHFHEVGAVDAIVDVVGCWLALDALDVTEVISGPVGLGRGSVEAAHGRLPIPAPATAELLVGTDVRPVDVDAETITPTGAALLVTMADRWGPIPAGRLVGTARGAGGRNPEHYPNVITGYVIEQPISGGTGDGQVTDAVVITTNLDDVTPETVGHTIGRCLAAGADDAWATPIVMKKSRPAVELHVLCNQNMVQSLQQLVFAETGTLGMRTASVTKTALDRRFEAVTVRDQTVRMKIGPYGAKPEYEDLAAAAEATGIPLKTLTAEALTSFSGRLDRGSFEPLD